MSESELLEKLRELSDAVRALRRLLPSVSEKVDHQLVIIFTILHSVQIEAALEDIRIDSRTGRGH